MSQGCDPPASRGAGRKQMAGDIAVALAAVHQNLTPTPEIPESPSRIEPGSLAASVMHSAAVVLGFHRRDADGRCTRPGCKHPCVIADYADKAQQLAKESTNVRALLVADRGLAGWIVLHLNEGSAQGNTSTATNTADGLITDDARRPIVAAPTTETAPGGAGIAIPGP